ncbi:hypothetical protein M0R04_13330 [Candidatus Dojkabacteria bacterium]|jgi:hypothetical protein|nr:hypothetical protein [Candidatus Dojkabacteria bacterium]
MKKKNFIINSYEDRNELILTALSFGERIKFAIGILIGAKLILWGKRKFTIK